MLHQAKLKHSLHEFQNKKLYTPFHSACQSGENASLKEFIQTGVEFHETLLDGMTPFRLLLKTGNETAIRLALKNGANLGQVDGSGRSDLQYACSLGDIKVVKCLINKGDNVNHIDEIGNTALYDALCKCDQDMLNCLLLAGGNVNQRYLGNSTLLHKACTKGFATIASELTKHRCDLNVKDDFGDTPLSLAIENGHNSLAMMLLFQGCFVTNAFPDRPSSGEVRTLLYWSGWRNSTSMPRIVESQTKSEVQFHSQIYLANHPIETHSDNGFHVLLDDLQNNPIEACKNVLLAKKYIGNQRRNFPTLCGIVRSCIRRLWSVEDSSLLSYVPKLKDSALPQGLKKYLFLYDESLMGLPDYRDDITEHFSLNVYYSDQTKKRVAEKYEFSHQSPSKKGKYTRVMKKCKKSKWKGYQDRKGRTLNSNESRYTDKANLYAAISWITISKSPKWILNKVVGICIKRGLSDKKVEVPVSFQNELVLIQQLVEVYSCSHHEDISDALKQLLQTFSSLLSSNTDNEWNIKPCGSFYLGNKVGDFDELDYWAVLTSPDIEIEFDGEERNFLSVAIPTADLHDLSLHPREYIKEGLCHYLKDEVKPDDPSRGDIYFKSIHLHSRGPGVCAQMAWMCEKGDIHNLGIDVSPVVLWEDKKLGDVWTAPNFFSKAPFKSIKSKLEALPVHLIPSSNKATSIRDGCVVSKCMVSYNTTKSDIFSCLDSVSPNVRRVFHLTKYVREFLPRRLRYTEVNPDFLGSWKDGSLISSYVLYNVLLQEVVKHPNTCDWSDPLLGDRLCDVLKSVARWSYIDFYRDRRENSFSLGGLGDVQKDLLLEVMERQMDRMTGAITALSSDYSDDAMMETSDVMLDTSRDKVNTNSVLVSRIYNFVCY